MEKCRKRCLARKDASLAEAECKMFSKLWSTLKSQFVSIDLGGKTQSIRTISIEGDRTRDRTPLVLVHGMGAGVGFWALNLGALGPHRPLYAFDLLGFGRSSRPSFSSNATEAESQFVDSIEEWRKTVGLENFILLGHSLGGFLSTAYSIKYPGRVRQLILADPWGFQDPAAFEQQLANYPTWVKLVAKAAGAVNPFALLRAAGPLGMRAVKRLRGDLLWKFSIVANEEDVAAYIYHCNSQTPSGEAGFKAMNKHLGWARNPMIQRVPDLPADLPVTFICGEDSWIDSDIAYQVKDLHHNTDIYVLEKAGHHVYADAAAKFNDIVNRVCHRVDQQSKEPGNSPSIHLSNNSLSKNSLAENSLSENSLAENSLDSLPSSSKMQSNFAKYRNTVSVPDFKFTKHLSKSDEVLSTVQQ